MDFQGQKEAEQWLTRLLVAFAAAAFLLGFALGSFQVMAGVYAAGGVLTLALVVPDWPMFNKHPLEWLPPLKAQGPPGQQQQAGKDSSGVQEVALTEQKRSSRRRA